MVIRRASELNLPINISTNGFLLDQERLLYLLEQTVNKIFISIHILSENYFKIRNAHGSFEDYTKKIASILKTFFLYKKGNTELVLKFLTGGFGDEKTLINYNEQDIGAICKLLKTIDTDIDVEIMRSFITSCNDNILSLITITPNLTVAFEPVGYWGNWPVTGVDCEMSGRKDCPMGNNTLSILCDGRCVPCCLDFNGENCCGNIINMPLENIIKQCENKMSQFLNSSICVSCRNRQLIPNLQSK